MEPTSHIALLERAFRRLPALHADLIWLVGVERHPLRDAARVLRLPESRAIAFLGEAIFAWCEAVDAETLTRIDLE